MMRNLAVALGLLILANGCVVRTQDFHCIRDGSPEINFELRMSPTSLEIKDVSYAFAEERGAERLYQNKQSGQTVRFNPTSGDLRLSETLDTAWLCKRYQHY
ncbi:MAG: hypothetical protein FJY35_00630 [Betaproteobacteria bacterium]|nr:hypothetical protein [Betaproteobacteria bacterium]